MTTFTGGTGRRFRVDVSSRPEPVTPTVWVVDETDKPRGADNHSIHDLPISDVGGAGGGVVGGSTNRPHGPRIRNHQDAAESVAESLYAIVKGALIRPGLTDQPRRDVLFSTRSYLGDVLTQTENA